MGSPNWARALWLRAERGPIEGYGNAEEEVACGDFDSVEQFIEEWKAWFPEEIKWYQLQAVQLKDEGYRAVMLGHKYVIVQDKRREPAGFPNEIPEFVQWLIDGVKECIEMLKAGTYNDFIKENLPPEHRTGKILRKHYWDIWPEARKEFFEDISAEDVAEFIRKASAQGEGSETIKERLPSMTANDFFRFCAMGYAEKMLYHFGMLDMKDEVLAHSHISTCMMPYITSQFMPRKESDRPTIIPKDCTNLALIGQYVEVPRDVVFTIETSVRTPLEAVYMLTGLDKEIIEVNPARYDLRYIKERVMKFGGMKGKITEEDLPKINPLKLWLGKAKLIKELLKKANEIPPYYIMYPGRDKSIALKDSVLKPQFPKDSR